jgi:hypothetical protein
MVQATKVRTIEVSVNTRPVTLTDEHGRAEATGAEIKAAAIAQGVSIQPDFALFVEHGNELDPVADVEVVHVRPHQKFRAVAPDDNS